MILKHLQTIFIFFILIACSPKEKRKLSEKKIFEKNEIDFSGRINRYFIDKDLIHIHGSPYDNIRSYSNEGILIKEVGKKGPADWELSSVWWYEENDSTYTIYDYGKNLINKFQSKTDSLLISYRFDSRSNLFKYNDNKFLSTQINEKGEFEFITIDISDKNYVNIFPTKSMLLELGVRENKDLDYLLYGDFARSQVNPDIFVYYCLNAPVFFKIDIKNEKIDLLKDFRYEFMPEVYRSGNNVVLTPNHNWYVSGAIIGDKIYFLTIQNKEYYLEVDSKWYLDIYDLESGLYEESIPVIMSKGDNYPFEIKNRNEELIIGWNFEKIKIYDVK
ncbi:hypothetical protein MM213_18285 [Belliella sp. R4-6]|uniref:Lipoprotein n=1 Tax=Belliella alkalica TaxID=1730871 RepID=A0ABS9VHF3_9BACT|nr:hypothetical protein [Belliella alkalica]MCH7415455.1 hypothetical protein [Belliella alkalica]